MLGKNLGGHLNAIALILDHANNHRPNDVVSLLRVGVRLQKLPIRQTIVAIVELSDVASEILQNHELSSRVDPLVTSSPQHKVVADDK